MRRLNNKGMSLIEIVVSFAITSVIIVSVLGSVMSYKNRVQTLSIKKDIMSYKNTVVQAIQNDFYKCGVKDATMSGTRFRNRDTIYITLSNNSADCPCRNCSKELTIVRASSRGEKSYIKYAESVRQSGSSSYKTQDVKYELPYYGDVFDKSNTYKYGVIRFGQAASTSILKSGNHNTTIVKPAVLKITIPIYATEGFNEDIIIIAPIDHQYCY